MTTTLSVLVPLSKIDRDAIPNIRKRHDAASFKRLSDDIEENGLKNPIELVPHPDKKKAAAGEYAVAAGYTRHTIVTKLGWESVPATIEPDADPVEASFMAFRENANREDLVPAEICAFIGKCDGLHIAQRDIAARTKLTTTSVSNYLRVFRAPMFQAWESLVYGNKAAPTFRDMLDILSQFSEKNAPKLSEEERAKKMVAAFDRMTAVREAQAKRKNDDGDGKKKKGKAGGARVSVRAGFEVGDQIKHAKNALKAVEAGEKFGELGPKDAGWLQGVLTALQWAIKKGDPPITFEEEQKERSKANKAAKE